MRPFGLKAGLANRVDVLGRGAEHRHSLGLGIVEQDCRMRMEWRSVVEQQCRARGEARDTPVPPPPAAGDKIENPIARAHVSMKLMLLEMLQQDAARAMHDTLGHTGGARGIKDVQRMAEWEASEFDFAGREGTEKFIQGDGTVRRLEIGWRGDIRHDHHSRDAFYPRAQLADLVQRVEGLAVVKIAVGDEYHLWFDLAEAIDHALDAE